MYCLLYNIFRKRHCSTQIEYYSITDNGTFLLLTDRFTDIHRYIFKIKFSIVTLDSEHESNICIWMLRKIKSIKSIVEAFVLHRNI